MRTDGQELLQVVFNVYFSLGTFFFLFIKVALQILVFSIQTIYTKKNISGSFALILFDSRIAKTLINKHVRLQPLS